MEKKWKKSVRSMLALLLCAAMLLPMLPALPPVEVSAATNAVYCCDLDASTTHTHTDECNIYSEVNQAKVALLESKIDALKSTTDALTYINGGSTDADKLKRKQELYAQFDEANQIFLTMNEQAKLSDNGGHSPAQTSLRSQVNSTKLTKLTDWKKMWANMDYFPLPTAKENIQIKLFDYGDAINSKITGEHQGLLTFIQSSSYGRTVDGLYTDSDAIMGAPNLYNSLQANNNAGCDCSVSSNLSAAEKATLNPMLKKEYLTYSNGSYVYGTKDHNGNWDNSTLQHGSLQYLFDPDYIPRGNAVSGTYRWMDGRNTAQTSSGSGNEARTIYSMADWVKYYCSSSSNRGGLNYMARAYLPVENSDGSGTGLFQQDMDGYYYYDSGKNAAWYNPEAKKFEVYNYTVVPGHEEFANHSITTNGNFIPFNKAHTSSLHGQNSVKIAGTSYTVGGEGQVDYYTQDSFTANGGSAIFKTGYGKDVSKIGTLVDNYVLEKENYRLKSTSASNAVNLNFGMVVEFDFYMPKDGKINGKPMEFIFKGDDDVWVYIDDKLVLDIGGSHDALNGTINFATGAVSYEHGAKNNWVNTTMTSIFGDDFENYSVHTLKFYYMERGGNVSFCRLKFNMPQLPVNGISVTKDLTDASGNDIEVLGNPDYYFNIMNGSTRNSATTVASPPLFLGIANTTYAKVPKVMYRILDADGKYLTNPDGPLEYTYNNVTYTDSQLFETDAYGIFKIKAGQTAVFEKVYEANASKVANFYVQELINSLDYAQYSSFYVNDASIGTSYRYLVDWTNRTYFSGTGNTGPYSTKWYGINGPVTSTTSTDANFVFDQNNRVNEANLATLNITKQMSYTTSTGTFDIYVELDGEPLPQNTKYTVGSTEKTVSFDTAGNSYVTLSAGQTASIKNILSGTKYKVWESSGSAGSYSVSYTGASTGSNSKVTCCTATKASGCTENHIEGILRATETVTVTITNAGEPSYTVSFYLVDKDGNPLASDGTTDGGFAASQKFTSYTKSVTFTKGATSSSIDGKGVFDEVMAGTVYKMYNVNADATVNKGSANKYGVTITDTGVTGNPSSTTYVMYGSDNSNTTVGSDVIDCVTNPATIYFAVYEPSVTINYGVYLANADGTPYTQNFGAKATVQGSYKMGKDAKTVTLTASNPSVTLYANQMVSTFTLGNNYKAFDNSATVTLTADFSTGNVTVEIVDTATATDKDSKTVKGSTTLYDSSTWQPRNTLTESETVTITNAPNSTVYFAIRPGYQRARYGVYLVNSSGTPIDQHGTPTTIAGAYKFLDGTNNYMDTDYVYPWTTTTITMDVATAMTNFKVSSAFKKHDSNSSITATPDLTLDDTTYSHAFTFATSGTKTYTSDSSFGTNMNATWNYTGASLQNYRMMFAVEPLPVKIKYDFYLVDENGRPVTSTGATGDVKDSVKLGNGGTAEITQGTTLKTTGTNSLTITKGSTTTALTNSIDWNKYELYDTNTGATITPDFITTGHKVGLTGSTTNADSKYTTYLYNGTSYDNTTGSDLSVTGNDTLAGSTVYFAVRLKPVKVKYQFYLVNSKGQPIDKVGATTTTNFAGSLKLGTATEVDVDGEEKITPVTPDSTKYALYDSAATATITPKPADGKYALAMTYGKTPDSTYFGTTVANAVATTNTTFTGSDGVIYFAVYAPEVSVQVGFYLVNSDGTPLKSDGTTLTSVSGSYKPGKKTSVALANGTATLDAAALLDDCGLGAGYHLYNTNAGEPKATVTADFKANTGKVTLTDSKKGKNSSLAAIDRTTAVYYKKSDGTYGYSYTTPRNITTALGGWGELKNTVVYFAVTAESVNFNYGIYLVDAKGRPIDETGAQRDYANSKKLGSKASATIYPWSTDPVITAEAAFTALGLDKNAYTLYDSGASVTVNPDFSTSKNQAFNITNSVKITEAGKYNNVATVTKGHYTTVINTGSTYTNTSATPADVTKSGTTLSNVTIYFAVKVVPTSINYKFYLVDDNGIPLKENGQTGSVGESKIVLEGTKTISSATTLTASALTGDLDMTVYELYDPNTNAVVTPYFVSHNHTVKLTSAEKNTNNQYTTYLYNGTSYANTAGSNLTVNGNATLAGSTVYFAIKVKQTTFQYSFYLVDENGNPIKENGTKTTWDQAYDFGKNPQVSDPISGATTAKPEDFFEKYGLDPNLYEIYDPNASSTITPDFSTAANHTVKLNEGDKTVPNGGSSTYVYDGTASGNNTEDPYTITGEDALEKTEVSFAVKRIAPAVDDTVVVDYGLPVNIDVIANDKISGMKVNGIKNADKTTVTAYTGKAQYSEKSFTDFYGEVAVNGDKLITYTPNTMSFTSHDQFSYEAIYSVKSDGVTTNYYYTANVTVVPATTIYYEDNFDGITYTAYEYKKDAQGKYIDANKDGINDSETTNDIGFVWTTSGTTISSEQDEDRPGADVTLNDDGTVKATDVLGAADMDSIYGYDSNYTNMQTYSMGSANQVTVDKDHYAVASFTFTGTGFDVISVTGNTTGTILVTATNKTTGASTSKLVNTYYGYGYVNGVWKETADENALYQIPVIKMNGLTHGTYDVTIKVSYMPIMDKTGNDAYDFYLDAIRVYDSAKDGEGNDVIKGAYTADGEGWPEYFELRNLILSTGDLNLDSTNGTVNGAVFIDGNSENGNFSVADYMNYGPKNELYLAPKQSIAFTLNVKTTANPDVNKIHMAMKSVGNGAAKVKIYKLSNGKLTEVSNVVPTAGINTATDLYYDITTLNGSTLVISNEGGTADAILSITNIKVTYSKNHTDNLDHTYITSATDNVQQILDGLKDTAQGNLPETTKNGITMMYASLSLEDEVHVNYYFTVNGITLNNNAGLLFFESNPGDDVAYADADVVVEGYATKGTTTVNNVKKTLYAVQSPGIPAKKLADTQYVCVYVKNGENYTYGPTVAYSPKEYATAMYNSTTDAKLKDLCAALLNYGAWAQTYFNYNVLDQFGNKADGFLANSGLPEAAKKWTWDSGKYAPMATTSGITATGFGAQNGITGTGSITLDGALAVNFYFMPTKQLSDNITLYYWVGEQTTLTKQNATKQTLVNTGSSYYSVRFADIAAKDMKKPIYVVAECGSYSSGVMAFSVNNYCAMVQNDNTANTSVLKSLTQATAIYGYYADKYFNNTNG